MRPPTVNQLHHRETSCQTMGSWVLKVGRYSRAVGDDEEAAHLGRRVLVDVLSQTAVSDATRLEKRVKNETHDGKGGLNRADADAADELGDGPVPPNGRSGLDDGSLKRTEVTVSRWWEGRSSSADARW